MDGIAIIGCGNIGLAVAEGIINGDLIPNDQITLTKRNLSSIDFLKESGVKVTTNNLEAVENSKYIILALKPYTITDIIEEIQPKLNENHVLISLASGVSINTLKEYAKTDLSYFRAMPNTAGAIQESMTCICSEDASSAEIKTVAGIFDNIGSTVEINEGLMEAATILGACGIAYALRFVRAMIQGGIEIGFDAKTASEITTQTVKGAAMLLQEKGSHPEFEIDKVTTPKGCTIKGLNEMEHKGFSSSLIQGITASFEKIEKG